MKAKNEALVDSTKQIINDKAQQYQDIVELTESCIYYMKRLENANLLAESEKRSLEAKAVNIKKQSNQPDAMLNSFLESEGVLNKKLDILRKRSKSNKEELEFTTSKLESLRQTHAKTENERAKLQLALKKSKDSMATESETLRKRIQELELELKALKPSDAFSSSEFKSLSKTEGQILLSQTPTELVSLIDILKREIQTKSKATAQCRTLTDENSALRKEIQQISNIYKAETKQYFVSKTDYLKK